MFRKRLMSRQDLDDIDIEIREMYFQIAAELLNPTPPQLSNTDGDPLALTTLTYDLKTTVAKAFESLAPLAKVHGEDHIDEVTCDDSGAVASAALSWVKAGNCQHKDWDNTVLGTLRLGADRLVAEVNSARRADRVKREIAKRMAGTATLVDTTVLDPFEVLAERRRDSRRVHSRKTASAEAGMTAGNRVSRESRLLLRPILRERSQGVTRNPAMNPAITTHISG